jgi:hypothetical protein
MGDMKMYTIFQLENQYRGDHVGDPVVYGWIILKENLQKGCGMDLTDYE